MACQWSVHNPRCHKIAYNNSPNQTPAYFIALSLWGQLTSYDLATGRVLTVLFGLLSLAIAYRLARDFVAPIAGIFALVIVSSNAFYNFYITELRMYPLLFCAAGLVLWLYLRIVYQIPECKDQALRGSRRSRIFAGQRSLPTAPPSCLRLAYTILLFVVQRPQMDFGDHFRIRSSNSFSSVGLEFLISRGVDPEQHLEWAESTAGSWDALAAWLGR